MHRGDGCVAQSGFGDLPDTVDAVSCLVAWLAVLDPVIAGLAFHRPLFAAVIAGDDAELTAGGLALGSHQRWPIGGAGTIADRLAAAGYILVEGVERHAVGANQDPIRDFGRR